MNVLIQWCQADVWWCIISRDGTMRLWDVRLPTVPLTSTKVAENGLKASATMTKIGLCAL